MSYSPCSQILWINNTHTHTQSFYLLRLFLVLLIRLRTSCVNSNCVRCFVNNRKNVSYGTALLFLATYYFFAFFIPLYVMKKSHTPNRFKPRFTCPHTHSTQWNNSNTLVVQTISSIFYTESGLHAIHFRLLDKPVVILPTNYDDWSLFCHISVYISSA